jgi:hypothetical protein
MLAAAVAAACVLALGVPPASASAVFSPPSPASPLPSPGWRAVPLPDVGNGSLNDLSALGPSSAWAVGIQILTNDAIVLHWDGTAWSTGPTTGIPAGVTLEGVDARSDRDILADGFDTSSGNRVVYRFNGSTWTLLPLPGAADTGFAPFGASFGPGGQIWGAGSVGGLPAFFKLTAAGWKTYPTGLSPGRAGRPQWMTATTSDSSSSFYLHFSHGAWTLVPGVALAGQVQPQMTVVHIPGTNATWAVGSAHDGPLISSVVPGSS